MLIRPPPPEVQHLLPHTHRETETAIGSLTQFQMPMDDWQVDKPRVIPSTRAEAKQRENEREREREREEGREKRGREKREWG